MKTATRRTTTAIAAVATAAVATAGVSSVFMGAAPAVAATETCGPTGTLVSPGVCELVFTSDGSFTRTAEMTKLEVLLVGAGGDAAYNVRVAGEIPTNGYAAGGGGGEVRVVDFSAAPDPNIAVVVSTPGNTGSITSGALVESVDYGLNGTGGSTGSGNGGTGGSGNAGQAFVTASTSPFGGGGGDNSVGSGANGGDGTVVSTLVAADSLFANDTNCYGGGGAVGVVITSAPVDPTQGFATCGGGQPTDASATAVVAATANSGGGAGAVNSALSEADVTGADGLVVVRWPSQVVLPATGGELNAAPMWIGIAALITGLGLAAIAAAGRKRRES